MSLLTRVARLEQKAKAGGRCPQCVGRPDWAREEIGGPYECAPDPNAAPCPACGWRPRITQLIWVSDFYGNQHRPDETPAE
jgi:hypothetical protein